MTSPPTRRELREVEARRVALRQVNAHRAKRNRWWRRIDIFTFFGGGLRRWS